MRPAVAIGVGFAIGVIFFINKRIPLDDWHVAAPIFVIALVAIVLFSLLSRRL